MKRKSTTITEEFDEKGNLKSKTTETIEEEEDSGVVPMGGAGGLGACGNYRWRYPHNSPYLTGGMGGGYSGGMGGGYSESSHGDYPVHPGDQGEAGVDPTVTQPPKEV